MKMLVPQSDRKAQVGATSELKAAAWLVEQGYETFRNVCSHGPVDFVAIKDGELLKLDVKTARMIHRGSEDRRGSAFRLKPKQEAMGVKALLVWDDGSFEIRDAEEWERAHPYWPPLEAAERA